MISATQLLWQTVLGRPQQDICSQVTQAVDCWICGGSWGDRCAPRDKAIGSNFTGQNRVKSPQSQWVCEPCVTVMSRTSPVPDRPPKEGKAFGGNYRNYSHGWWRDTSGRIEYINASKGDKPKLLTWLRKPKPGQWWCTVADSGQKHMLPWAPINRSPTHGAVLFDDLTVMVGGWALVDDMCEVLTAGATKEELQTGDYQAGSILRCRQQIIDFEARYGASRGGSWYSLCLWLAQRDEERVAARMAAEKEAKRDAQPRGKKRGDNQAARSAEVTVPQEPELQPTQALGAAGHTEPSSSSDVSEPARVDHVDVQDTAAGHTGQLGLWGVLGLAEPAAKPKRRR